MCARHRQAVPEDAGRRVLRHAKVDDIAGTARRTDPRFGHRDGCSRSHDRVRPQERWKAGRHLINGRRDRRGVRMWCGNPQLGGFVGLGRSQLDGLDGRDDAAARGHIAPSADHTLIVDQQGDGRGVPNFQADGRRHRRYGSPVQSPCRWSLRPSTGRRADSSGGNSIRSMRWSSAASCRSSGAWITRTPLVSLGGNRRSLR